LQASGEIKCFDYQESRRGARSVRGRASLTLSERPPMSFWCSAWMASSAPLDISTKPKPRGRPVSRSVIKLTVSTLSDLIIGRTERQVTYIDLLRHDISCPAVVAGKFGNEDPATSTGDHRMTSKGALIISTAGRDGNELSLLAGRVALVRWTNPGFDGIRSSPREQGRFSSRNGHSRLHGATPDLGQDGLS